MDATDGLAAAHVPAARSKGPKALPTKPPKVVPARKSKKAEQAAAPEDTELAEQMAIEQAGRNSHGIEGRENLHASYLAEAIAQRNMMSKLRMKWATRVADFRNQGVNTRAVNAIIKELGDDADSSVAWHNVMNQLRAMVGLPAFGTLELPSLVKGDAERDALAEEEAKRCGLPVWRRHRSWPEVDHEVPRGACQARRRRTSRSAEAFQRRVGVHEITGRAFRFACSRPARSVITPGLSLLAWTSAPTPTAQVA
jgi:hypothetical protein